MKSMTGCTPMFSRAGSAEHREEQALGKPGSQRVIELGLRELAALEVFFHQGVVHLGQVFDDLAIDLFKRVLHVCRNSGLFKGS